MKSTLKKVICIVLCLSMLMIFPLSAAAASAPTLITANGANPVVVINGWQNNALYINPESTRAEKVFPPETNDFVTLAEIISLYTMMGEGYYDEVTSYIGPKVESFFKYIPCNNDGTPKSNVGVKKMIHSMAYYQKNTEMIDSVAGELGKICAAEAGYDRVYVFSYDWRLSPMDLAAELDEFIEETVLPETNEDKVNILAEGMGANVASAYLKKYQEPRNFSSIDNYVLINSTAQGMSTIGALYTGEIDVDPNGVVRWINDQPDNVPVAFAFWLTNYILNKEWELYHACATIDAYLIHELDRLYDQYARPILCYNAGLWALIPWTEDDETFDRAKEMMYTDSEGNELHMNGTLENKIDAYHEVQRTAGATLQNAQKAGVKVAVVSGYNLQALPLYDGLDSNKGSSETSDGIVDAKYSSFGATCAYLNDVWVGKPLPEQAIDDGHNHTDWQISDTYKIGVDASTCALPENTWFIKGLKNDYLHSYSQDSYYFVSWLIFADEQRTIRDNGYYPQFIEYDRFNDRFLKAPDYNLLGDVDLDGKVTTSDARLALRAAVKLVTLSGASAVNADVDGNGIINSTDARYILRYAVDLLDYFPLEDQ